jgi:uncharacterized protein with PIN domain
MPDLVQNACLDCRKVFKKPDIPYVHEAELEKRKFYPCPDCGKMMQYMGVKFRAPPKRDLAAWDKIRDSIQAGENWM